VGRLERSNLVILQISEIIEPLDVIENCTINQRQTFSKLGYLYGVFHNVLHGT
jgi:hypothetical protein